MTLSKSVLKTDEPAVTDNEPDLKEAVLIFNSLCACTTILVVEEDTCTNHFCIVSFCTTKIDTSHLHGYNFLPFEGEVGKVGSQMNNIMRRGHILGQENAVLLAFHPDFLSHNKKREMKTSVIADGIWHRKIKQDTRNSKHIIVTEVMFLIGQV